MRTKDIKVGAEYAYGQKDWEVQNPSRVVVKRTGVEYKGVDSASRIYRTKTFTGGVEVEYLNKAGELTGRTDIVRPAGILRTWAEQEEVNARAAEAQGAAQKAKADRDARIEAAEATLTELLDESRYGIRKHYTQGLGYTGFELSVSQVEKLLALIEK